MLTKDEASAESQRLLTMFNAVSYVSNDLAEEVYEVAYVNPSALFADGRHPKQWDFTDEELKHLEALLDTAQGNGKRVQLTLNYQVTLDGFQVCPRSKDRFVTLTFLIKYLGHETPNSCKIMVPFAVTKSISSSVDTNNSPLNIPSQYAIIPSESTKAVTNALLRMQLNEMMGDMADAATAYYKKRYEQLVSRGLDIVVSLRGCCDLHLAW